MSENQAGQVLTNENAAEFYAQKLGLAQAEAPTEAVVEETPTEPVSEEVPSFLYKFLAFNFRNLAITCS